MTASTIALIGYRGTGKTTVAQLVALRLQYDWVDADVELELAVGMSITEFFEQFGEARFREIEAQQLAELCRRERTVLALGGGAVLREDCRLRLAECGMVVWLKASAATLGTRIAHDPTSIGRRPKLTNCGDQAEIEALLAEREPIYRACATLEVDTEDKSPEAVADEIVAALGGASDL